MSKHTYFDAFKRRAKAFARNHALKLSVAQEQLAKQAGFTNLHDLTIVTKRSPSDPRLVRAAFGVEDVGELIYEEPSYGELNMELGDALAGDIAETNAYAFGLDDLVVSSSIYDADTGQVLIDVTFQYTGEQDADKVYHGATFYVVATVRLHWHDCSWHLSDDDGLEILECENERDLDYRQVRASDRR